MDEQSMREIYRMTQENNKMLHAMRRNAFWGGLIKLIFYAALLLAPIWFYMTYLDDTMQQLLNAYSDIQGTGANAQTQFGDFSAMLKELQSKLGGSTQ